MYLYYRTLQIPPGAMKHHIPFFYWFTSGVSSAKILFFCFCKSMLQIILILSKHFYNLSIFYKRQKSHDFIIHLWQYLSYSLFRYKIIDNFGTFRHVGLIRSCKIFTVEYEIQNTVWFLIWGVLTLKWIILDRLTLPWTNNKLSYFSILAVTDY